MTGPASSASSGWAVPDEQLLAAHAAGDPHDALQDAFLSAHRAAGRFRADSQVSTWLHRIVVNACLDRLRKRSAHPTVPLSGEAHDEPVEPRDAVAEQDTRLLVHRALMQIPLDQRAAVVAVDVEGFSVADAAVALGGWCRTGCGGLTGSV